MKYDDSEVMKQNIINAAIDVFSKNGFMASNVQDIAKAAGLSRGPVYYYFDNKITLYIEAVRAVSKKDYEQYEKIFSNETNIWEKLREDLNFCTKYIKQNTTNRLYDVDASVPEEAVEIVKKHYMTIYDMKKKFIVADVKDGDEKVAEEMTKFLFVMYEGLTALMINKNVIINSESTDDAISSIIEMLKKYYGDKMR